VNLDRTKQGLSAFVLAQFPQFDYLGMYGGVVVAQRGPNSFDFQPDDPRLPGHAGIPIKLPFPGFALTLDATQTPRALLGWVGADPSQPELRLWENPGLSALVVTAEEKVSLVAAAVNLGGDPAPQQLVLGNVFAAALTVLLTSVSAALTAIAAGFIGGAAAWTAAGGLLPVLSPPATVVAPIYTAAATACTAAVTAISTFVSNLPQSLSTISRTN
jgi:hypothetical protein